MEMLPTSLPELPKPSRILKSFEGVWAVHTTVIRAADQREVGNLVRNRAPKTTGGIKFAEMLCFPTNLLARRSRYKVFH